MGFEDPCEVLGQCGRDPLTGQSCGSQSLSLAPGQKYIPLSGSVNPGREIPKGIYLLLPWTAHMKFRTDSCFVFLSEIPCA